MRFSPVLAMGTAALLAIPGSATAAGLGPSSKKFVAASASVSPCGSLSGITLTWAVADGIVASVALGSIPAACTGGSLSLTLADSSGTSLASAGPVTLTGTSQTLGSLTGSADATAVAGAYVSVTGP